MSKLYSELAGVYHEMYGSIFDYEKEFRLYDGLLKKYRCRSVLETACGSGRLASYLIKAGYRYAGLDLSADLLRIARREHPGAEFVCGDMRDFRLGRRVDAALITGRSFSHLVTNEDILTTLKSVHAALKKKGVLVFDVLRADEMIRNLGTRSTQTIRRGDTIFRRLNRTSLRLDRGWTFDWDAEYRISERGHREKTIGDRTVLRAFTEDELRLFLELAGYEVLDVIREKVYLVVARKNVRRAWSPSIGRAGRGPR
jgi:SAM-dependent methyltransferase